MKRRDFLYLAAVPLYAAVSTRRAEPETAFRSPGPHPNGLQATADGLWILDQGDNRAYLVSYSDGKVLRSLATESKAGSGITYDGTSLWLASTYSREIIQADAHTGKTIAKHPTPGAGVVHWTAETGRRSPLAPPAPAADEQEYSYHDNRMASDADYAAAVREIEAKFVGIDERPFLLNVIAEHFA